MPCLLRELATSDLDKHRQLDPLFPAVPLLIQFTDNWVPAGIFTILVAYLQNVAGWKLYLSSGNPCYLYCNCVEFSLSSGHRGLVTLVDSYVYLEVHIKATENCEKSCPLIIRDIFSSMKEAACRLHYSPLQPKIAFFCLTPSPACSRAPGECSK